MAIDIDKGFKKVSELRFYEIKNEFCQQVAKLVDKTNKAAGCTKKKGKYHTLEQQDAALEIMKKRLIEGHACKVAVIDSGFKATAANKLFKRRTGKTMREFQLENQSPQSK